jgi:hypothetical protein
VYVTVAVWLRADPAPVIVTVYVPRVPVQDRVEVPLVTAPRAILVGESVQVSPAEGETVAVSETVLVKPLKPETVMVEGPGEPDDTFRVGGLVDTVKSWTV